MHYMYVVLAHSRWDMDGRPLVVFYCFTGLSAFLFMYVLQCVAVCCRVCCRVLQCVAACVYIVVGCNN